MQLDQDRVPATVEQALALLEEALTPSEKGAWTGMTAAKMFTLQAEIAQVLRRDWSLDDENTALRIFFRELGLDDAEEVSNLLIDAYWRRRNQKEITVKELVEEYLEGLT